MRRIESRTLHYFLPRGRIAELRVPRDLDHVEARRLLAHLKVDLGLLDLPPTDTEQLPRIIHPITPTLNPQHWATTTLVCPHCDYEHVAVFRVDTPKLKCPSCNRSSPAPALNPADCRFIQEPLEEFGAEQLPRVTE